MKKAIVTGAGGFIGRSLVEKLSSSGVDTIAVYRGKSVKSHEHERLPRVRSVFCDMENIKSLPGLVPDRDIDVCVHLAWTGSFGNDRADYAKQLENVRYSVEMVDTAALMGIKRFVGAGTLAEKDVLNYHLTDGARPNAVSIYGIAKNAAHMMTKTECTKLGIEHIWCFLANTYGVGNTTDNFVNMASRLMLSGKRAAFTSGEQEYDFVYVTDTVKAICAVAEKGKTNSSYYLGSGSSRPLKEYIKIIRNMVNPTIELHLGEIPFNGNPLPREAYDTRKLQSDTGFYASIKFEEGIKLTVDWLRTLN